MPKFTLKDNVADAVLDIQSLYDEGKIEGMAVVILTTDGIIDITFSNLSHMERFGLARYLENATEHMLSHDREED